MKKLLLLVTLLCLGACLWIARDHPWVSPLLGFSRSLRSFKSGADLAQPPSRTSEGGPAVPVIAGVSESRDVPVYLNGLGNVQGFNNVTIRSRVDGQIQKVAFTEGQEVQAGQLIAQIDPRPFQAALDQVLARRKQNEALLANARRDLARDLALLADKAGTAQKADTQQALVEQLEATLLADAAAIEAAAVQLGYATITSPISGRAGIRMVDEGNVVRAQDTGGLVTVTQMRPISVIFTLPEQHLQAIRTEADKGALPVVAIGRDNANRLAEGSLSVIDSQIDSSTGTVRLKATFTNEDLKLWPGQFVNVRLRLAVRSKATVVPSQAVQMGPSGTFVFVISPENIVELRPVQVGRMEDGLALIESGLQSG